MSSSLDQSFNGWLPLILDLLQIHVDRTTARVEDTLASQKLMHRFTDKQVEELLDNVEAK